MVFFSNTLTHGMIYDFKVHTQNSITESLVSLSDSYQHLQFSDSIMVFTVLWAHKYCSFLHRTNVTEVNKISYSSCCQPVLGLNTADTCCCQQQRRSGTLVFILLGIWILQAALQCLCKACCASLCSGFVRPVRPASSTNFCQCSRDYACLHCCCL